jgi:hypothetical protein
VKKYVASVRQPNEPMTLADKQRHNSAGTRRSVAFRWSHRGLATSARLPDDTSRVRGHAITSAVPSVDATRSRRRTRRCDQPSDGLR